MKEIPVTYTATNPVYTLNDLTETTEKVWIVFHGMGHLSRYFLRHFQGLPPDKNFIVAPQAPSRYYLTPQYDRIGASWLTRELRDMEMSNIISFLDQMMDHLQIPEHCQRNFLGFSQGVSILSRWMSATERQCDRLFFWAGRLPEELNKASFTYLNPECEVYEVYGEQDPYISPEILLKEQEKLDNWFTGRVKVIPFNGGHKMSGEILNSFG